MLDGPLAAFPYAIRDGRGARAPGEVTLGRGALDALDAQDRRHGSRCASDGKPVALRVVGRHVEPDDEGRGAVTAPEQPARGGGRARRALLGRPPLARRRRRADRGGAAPRGRRADPRSSGRSSRCSARQPTCARVVYGTVALLLVIAALNLLTTLGLAIRERERDYAVLASVGATPRQVRTTVIAGGAALALPAALLGLPLGDRDLHARDRRDRPRGRPRRAHAARCGGGIRSRSPARWCSPPRSARSPRARRRASARRRRCALNRYRQAGVVRRDARRGGGRRGRGGGRTRSSARARW